MAGYVRQDVANEIEDGNTILADPIDTEYNALASAFSASSGHKHDGSTGEGAPITVVGPSQNLVVSTNSVTPKTDDTIDLGSPTLEFKNLYIDGVANIDSLAADAATVGGVAVTTATNTQTLTGKTINLTNNTLVATSAQLAAAVTDETGTGNLVFSDSPALTGVPTAPTAAPGTDTTQVATTAFVIDERDVAAVITNKTIDLSDNTLVATSAELAAAVTDETGSGALVFANSPSLTGTPTAPTATTGNNTTQIATTAFVKTAIDGLNTIPSATFDNPTINGGTMDGAAITGGSISSLATDLPIADGGTGSSSAPAARTALGLAIGTDVQAYDAGLQSISGLTTVANRMLYTTGSDTYAVTPITSLGRNVVAAADTSAVLTAMGLSTATTSVDGLMSAADKTKLNGIETGAEVNTVTSVAGKTGDVSIVWNDVGSKPAVMAVGATINEARAALQFDETPIGVIQYWIGERSAIPDGWDALDGQVVNRADFPDLWAMVDAATFPVITDEDWIALPEKRGSFSTGNGTTTFRFPDANGKVSLSLQGPYFRGDGKAGTAVGDILGDAIRNITGSIGGISETFTTSTGTGALYRSSVGPVSLYTPIQSDATNAGTLAFDASLIVPTADENRPVSFVAVAIMRTRGATSGVIAPGTHATLGSNTFSGSQSVGGDMEVQGTLTGHAPGANPDLFLRGDGVWATMGGRILARAVFNGTNQSIRPGSFNVTSITRHGVGDYSLNFTNALPDTNAAVMISVAAQSGNAWTYWGQLSNPTALTTTQARIRTGYVSGTNAGNYNTHIDAERISVMIIGD